jgi:hypothetical protein
MQGTGKPDQNVEVRAARLVSLTDPNEARNSTTTTKPHGHAIEESTHVTRGNRLRWSVRKGKEEAAKTHTTAQGIDLQTVRGTEHGTTHAAQARAQRV